MHVVAICTITPTVDDNSSVKSEINSCEDGVGCGTVSESDNESSEWSKDKSIPVKKQKFDSSESSDDDNERGKGSQGGKGARAGRGV